MGMTRSWNLEILDPRLSTITEVKADETDIYKKILKVRDWNEARDKMPDKVKVAEFGGFGPFGEVFEKETPPDADAIKGVTNQAVFRKFALKTDFSEEVRDDDRFGVCDTLAGKMGTSYNMTRELQGASVWENGFNTTVISTGEGKGLFSLTHDAAFGARINHQNMLTDSEPLSYSGFQNLLLIGTRQTSLDGFPAKQFNPKDKIAILYQPEDMWAVSTLTNDMARYIPGSNHNDINVLLANYSFEPLMNEWMNAKGAVTATRLWALHKIGDSGVEMIDRWNIRTSTYTENGNQTLVHSARGRWALLLRTWRNSLGSGN